MIIYRKLQNIEQNSHQSFLKAIKPRFKMKKNQKDSFIINNIKSLAQENLFILKRLLTQESDYSAEKMRQKYKQSQKYKNILCHYPSINFNKTKTTTKPLIKTFELTPKKHNLPKINGHKRNFMTLQAKYMKKELDSHYLKGVKKVNKNNTVTNARSNTKKNTMNIVTENEDESSNSNQKIKDEENSGSNEGSQNEDEEDNKSGSGSGSGSSSGEEKE